MFFFNAYKLLERLCSSSKLVIWLCKLYYRILKRVNYILLYVQKCHMNCVFILHENIIPAFNLNAIYVVSHRKHKFLLTEFIGMLKGIIITTTVIIKITITTITIN